MYLSFFGIALQFVFIWSLYTNDAGQYRILAPKEMESKQKIIYTNLGKVHMFTSFTEWSPKESQNGLFMVHYYDLPKENYRDEDELLISDMFHTISDELKEVYTGELIYENDIKLLDTPGRLMRIDYNGGASTLKAKIFLDNNRIYVLQVLSDKSWSLDESVNRFLDSFEILE